MRTESNKRQAEKHRFAAMALLLSLCLAPFLAAFQDRSGNSMVLRGDFPGFYSPAVTVARGLGDRLYDVELQRAIQNEFFPAMLGKTLITVYPPIVALALTPFAALPPLAAKALASLLLALLLIATIAVAKRFAPLLREQPVIVGVLLFSTAPLYASVLAAQNTVVSMFLLSLATMLLFRGGKRDELFAGAALGMLLYKPQFGAPILLLLLLTRRRPLLWGASCSAAVWYFAGVLLLGWSWPSEWATAAGRFGELNYEVNGFQMVSAAGLLYGFGLRGQCFVWLTLAATAVLALPLIRRFWLAKNSTDIGRALLVASAALPLISPQTLFYDLSLAALPLVALAPERRTLLPLYALVQLFMLARYASPFPWLALVAVGCYLLAERRA